MRDNYNYGYNDRSMSSGRFNSRSGRRGNSRGYSDSGGNYNGKKDFGIFDGIRRSFGNFMYNAIDLLRGDDGFGMGLGERAYSKDILSRQQYYPGDIQPPTSPYTSTKEDRKAYKEYMKENRKNFFKKKEKDIPTGADEDMATQRGLGGKAKARLASKLSAIGEGSVKVAKGMAGVAVNIAKTSADGIMYAAYETGKAGIDSVTTNIKNEDVKSMLNTASQAMDNTFSKRETTEFNPVKAFTEGMSGGKITVDDFNSEELSKEIVLDSVEKIVNLSAGVLYSVKLEHPITIDTRELLLSSKRGCVKSRDEVQKAKAVKPNTKMVISDEVLAIPSQGKYIVAQGVNKIGGKAVAEIEFRLESESCGSIDEAVKACCKFLYIHPKKNSQTTLYFKIKATKSDMTVGAFNSNSDDIKPAVNLDKRVDEDDSYEISGDFAEEIIEDKVYNVNITVPTEIDVKSMILKSVQPKSKDEVRTSSEVTSTRNTVKACELLLIPSGGKYMFTSLHSNPTVNKVVDIHIISSSMPTPTDKIKVTADSIYIHPKRGTEIALEFTVKEISTKEGLDENQVHVF